MSDEIRLRKEITGPELTPREGYSGLPGYRIVYHEVELVFSVYEAGRDAELVEAYLMEWENRKLVRKGAITNLEDLPEFLGVHQHDLEKEACSAWLARELDRAEAAAMQAAEAGMEARKVGR